MLNKLWLCVTPRQGRKGEQAQGGMKRALLEKNKTKQKQGTLKEPQGVKMGTCGLDRTEAQDKL